MRRNIINISFILFLFTFIFFLADSNRNYLFSAEVRGVTNNTIKLGVIADMTGPASDIWLPVTDGIKTHFMSVNDNGGINGRKVKIIIEDDRFSIPLALSAFKKLLFRDKVLTICGTSGQGHTYAVIPKMEQARMPLFAVIADHKYVIPARKYIFGVLPYYDDQIKITFEYIHNDLKAKKPKISFLYMDSGSSKPLIPLVRRLAKKYRVKLSEIIIPISGIDMTSEVLRLKKEDPDYVIMNAYIGNSSAILRTAKKFNFRKPFFVTQYGAVKTTVELAKDSAENFFGLNCFGLYNDKTPGMTSLRKAKQKFDPGSGYQDTNFTQGWFVGIVMSKGMKNAGKNLNGETLVKGVNKINNFNTKGICGIINFNSNDHKAIDYSRIFKTDIKNKVLIPITDWRKPNDI